MTLVLSTLATSDSESLRTGVKGGVKAVEKFSWAGGRNVHNGALIDADGKGATKPGTPTAGGAGGAWNRSVGVAMARWFFESL
jgi:hypothetical protein